MGAPDLVLHNEPMVMTSKGLSNAGNTAKPLGEATKSPQQRNKQSLNYVVRSGIAGGIAGCAVCVPPLFGGVGGMLLTHD